MLRAPTAELDARSQAELLANPKKRGSRRSLGDTEASCDFSVGVTISDKLSDRNLTRGEPPGMLVASRDGDRVLD